MDTTRTIYISDYFYNNHTDDDLFRDKFFYIKLHALFNCLTLSEIKTLYFKHSIHSEKFKGTILNFIGRKSELNSSYFSVIAKELIENYSYQTFSLQIAYRTFLSQIIKNLEKDIIKDYFHLFINSKRINDRKKAYEVANFFWADVEHTIRDNFYRFKDECALTHIIHNSESFDLVIQLENFWAKNLPNNRLKKILIEKTHKEDICYFEFLKNTELNYYIDALIVRKQPIDKKLLNSLISKMKPEKNGYLFHYLGLARDWDLLTDIIKTMKTERFD